MKWSIWLQPNKIVSEEYPDGWTRDDVMEASQSRWGGKVNTVTAGDNVANSADTDHDYSNDYSYSSDYSDSDSDSSLGLGSMFGSVIMVGLAIGGIVMFTTSDDNNYQPATSEPTIMEQVQKTFSDIAPAKDHPLQFNIRELPKSTPAQYRAEENGCDIWRKAQPALAAQLQPGDKCYR